MEKRKIKEFRKFYCYIGNNTILKVSNKHIELLSIFRLKQFENYEFASDLDIKTYDNSIENTLYKLRTFDNNKDIQSGVIYKFYSYFKKNTLLQDYWLYKNRNEKDELIVFNKMNVIKEDFNTIREFQLKEKILNIPLYHKEDFLVIRTVKKSNQISFLPNGWNLMEYFGNFNQERVLELKNSLNMFFNEHKSNYDNLNVFHKEQPSNQKDFMSSIHKLGLKDDIIGYNSLNFLEMIEKEEYCDDVMICEIKKTELDILPDIVEISSNFLQHKIFNKNDSVYLLKNDETVEKTFNKNIEKITFYKKKGKCSL